MPKAWNALYFSAFKNHSAILKRRMNSMKKLLSSLLIVALLAASLFAGAALAENKTLKVVTTIFPIYDWVRQIAGDGAGQMELTMLLDSGSDLHNFQPSASDILKVAQADLFIYVGGESDGWVDGVLATANNPNLKVINLVEALGDRAKAEETVEGMEHHHDEEDEDHDHEDHDHEEEEEEMDEHVWLSLRNAQVLCQAIADALSQIDPENTALYQENLFAYSAKLGSLDQAYADMVAASAYKTVLFGDRFPFRYLADDYGLTYYAAFSGCSAESEASFQTIVFLAQKVDELDLPAVMTIEHPKARIAETIVATTQKKNQKILSMDSLQSVTAQDVQAGVTYLSVMESNFDTLKQALN